MSIAFDVVLKPAFSGSRGRFLLAAGAILLFALILGMASAFGGGTVVLAVAGGLAVVIAILLDWRVGVALLMVLFPQADNAFMPRSMGGVTGFNPLNVVLASTFASMLIDRAVGHGLRRFVGDGPLIWLYALPLAAWAVYGAGFAHLIPSYFYLLELVSFEGPGQYLRDVLVRNNVFTIMVIIFVATAVANTRAWHRMLYPAWAALVAFALCVIYYVLTSGIPLSVLAQASYRKFFDGLGLHANDIGLLLNLGLALLVFSLRGVAKRREKAAILLSIALVAVAELLVFSRAGVLGLVTIVLARFANRRQIGLILVLCGLAYAAIKFAPSIPFIARLSLGFASGDRNEITAGRTEEIWEPLWPTFLDNPLFGHGLSSILWAEATRRGQILEVVHPHSAYYELLLDIGMVGTCIVAGFYIHLFRLFQQTARTVSDPLAKHFLAGCKAALLVLVVQGASGQSFEPSPKQAFFWMAAGCAMGLRARGAFANGALEGTNGKSPAASSV